jgi:hypothetical protein
MAPNSLEFSGPLTTARSLTLDNLGAAAAKWKPAVRCPHTNCVEVGALNWNETAILGIYQLAGRQYLGATSIPESVFEVPRSPEEIQDQLVTLFGFLNAHQVTGFDLCHPNARHI